MRSNGRIRGARRSDAGELGRIHADTWEATYLGQVPDHVATEGLARVRARDWAQHLDDRLHAGGGVLVLVDDGGVAGFCEFGPTEDADDDSRCVGQILRLYVLPGHQGSGGGRRLLEAASGRLAEDGYRTATLWTLYDETNRACGFYTHLGWSCDGVLNGEQPPDIRYRRRLS